MKYNVLKTNFSAGQLSEKLRAREDIDQYSGGTLKMENFLPYKSGGVSRRDNTKCVLKSPSTGVTVAMSASNKAVQFPYVDSEGNPYIVTMDALTNAPTLVSTNLVFSAGATVWTASGSGTDEYYFTNAAGSAAGHALENRIFEDGTRMTLGTVGSLAVGEWAFDDNDALGFNTYYVRLSSGAPDVNPTTAQASNYFVSVGEYSAVPWTVFRADTGVVVDKYIVPGIWANSAIVDSKGFHHTQFGKYLIITHSSGLLEPIVFYKADYEISNGVAETPYMIASLRHAFTPLDVAAGWTKPARYYLPAFKLYNPDTGLNLKVSAAGTSAGVAEADFSTTCIVTCYDGAAAETSLFDSPHPDYWVNRYIRIFQATNEGVLRITKVLNPSQAEAEILVGFDNNTTAYDTWAMSEWGGAEDYGVYPRTVTGYQSRLIFGGTSENTAALWAGYLARAQQGIFMQLQLVQEADTGDTDASGINYFGGANDSNPFSKELASSGSDNIRTLCSIDGLFVGTNSTEFLITGTGGVFSSSTAVAEPKSYYGADGIMPCVLSEGFLYVAYGGREIRYVKYKSVSGQFSNISISLLNEDILSTIYAKFVGCAYDRLRGVAWFIEDTSNGDSLYAVNIEETGNSIGMSVHPLGIGTGDSVRIESVVSVGDYMYLACKRTINAAKTAYYERLINQTDYDDLAYHTDAGAYLDCATAAITTLGQTSVTDTNYANIAALTVINPTDGTYEVVSVNGSGEFTITATLAAGSIIYGLAYDSEIHTLPLKTNAQFGDSRGHITQIDRVVVMLYDTKQLKIGSEYGYYEKTWSTNFTGDFKVDFNHSPDIIGQVRFLADSPYKANILGLSVKGNLRED